MSALKPIEPSAATGVSLRENGFSDGEIVDIIGAVGLNIFRNYFNLVVGTDIDVPVVRTSRSALGA